MRRPAQAIELQSLIDIGFEVELTGFETPDIDLLLDEALEATGLSPADDQLPVIRTGAAPPVADERRPLYPPKADICSATRHVRFGPIADIRERALCSARLPWRPACRFRCEAFRSR